MDDVQKRGVLRRISTVILFYTLISQHAEIIIGSSRRENAINSHVVFVRESLCLATHVARCRDWVVFPAPRSSHQLPENTCTQVPGKTDGCTDETICQAPLLSTVGIRQIIAPLDGRMAGELRQLADRNVES